MHASAIEARGLKSTKLIFPLLGSVMLVAVIIFSPVISLQMSSLTINSIGQILSPIIIAGSGSAEDIQAAIDLAIATRAVLVEIPAGDFEFNPSGLEHVSFNVPDYVLTIRGAGIGNTILNMTSQPVEWYGMFLITDSARTGGSVRVTGITFNGFVDPLAVYPTVGVRVRAITDFRIDHCEFLDFESAAIGSDNSAGYSEHRGVIDHNIFDNPYKDDPVYTGSKMWGYGIISTSDYTVGEYKHPVDYYLGQYDGKDDIIYIEDNVFKRCRHSIASNQNAWYVARHNEFHDVRPFNYGHVDVHGASGPNTAGGRGLESYNNLFVGYGGSNDAHWLRGGSGVVFNNTYQNMHSGTELYNEDEAFKVQDLYIWDNTPESVVDYDDYTEGVDYYVGQPLPGYISYPYPHPLTLIP